MLNRTLSLMVVALVIGTGSSMALGQSSTAFTYQGTLSDGGLAADGVYDFRFELWTAEQAGTTVGGPLFVDDLTVAGGQFATELDFGDLPFDGADLWLLIAVRDGASTGTFTDLLPRQPVLRVPYALQADFVAPNSITAVEIDEASVQRRVSGTCAAGSSVRRVEADGTVVCEPDDDTTYQAGVGLDLSGTVFAIDDQVVQRRVSTGCPAGQTIQTVNADGTVVCAADSDTTYQAGDGLALAGTTFSVDDGVVQRRVTGTCSVGSFVSAINADGTVVCSSVPDPFPGNPLIQSGFVGSPVTTSPTGAIYGWVVYDRPFAEPPITLVEIDESLDVSGASWVRLRRDRDSRAAVRMDRLSEGLHWFAMEPGNFTVSGKQIQAGKVTPANNGQTISYPVAFAAPPVVFLTIDESTDNNGAVYSRVINTPTNESFEVWMDAPGDALNWVAMEPGDYSNGRYAWRVGVFSNAGCSFECIIPLNPPMPSTPGVILTLHDTDNNGSVYTAATQARPDEIRFFNNGPNTEFTNYLVFVELP